MEKLLECVPSESKDIISGFLLQLQSRIDELEKDYTQLRKENDTLRAEIGTNKRDIDVLNISMSNRMWHINDKKGKIKSIAPLIKNELGDSVRFWNWKENDQFVNEYLIMSNEKHVHPRRICQIVNDYANFSVIKCDYELEAVVNNPNFIEFKL